MKKRMISVIAVIAALSLAGCGSSETKSTDNAAETTAATTTVTTAAPAETTEPVSETEAATETAEAARPISDSFTSALRVPCIGILFILGALVYCLAAV